ncbi:putative G-box binding protein, multifunctional mosaic region [Helianthus anomalus]
MTTLNLLILVLKNPMLSSPLPIGTNIIFANLGFLFDIYHHYTGSQGLTENDGSPVKEANDSANETPPTSQPSGNAMGAVPPDWTGFQAYSPMPPPGYLASSPQPPPYMWGVQVLRFLNNGFCSIKLIYISKSHIIRGSRSFKGFIR